MERYWYMKYTIKGRSVRLVKAAKLFTTTYRTISTISLLIVTAGIVSTLAYAVTPTAYIDANIYVESDGTALTSTDSVSWAGNGNSILDGSEIAANAGKDSDFSPGNNIVKTLDSVVYRVSTNLNGGETNNALFSFAVDNATIQSLPDKCLTAGKNQDGSNITPISSISTNKKTLLCNIGFTRRGSTSTILIGTKSDTTTNDTKITATVTPAPGSTSAPAVNNDVIITGSPKINLIKYDDEVVIVAPPSTSYEPAYTRDVCVTPGTGAIVTGVNTLAGCTAGNIFGDILNYKFKLQHGSSSEKLGAIPALFLTDRITTSNVVGTTGIQLISCDPIAPTTGSISCNTMPQAVASNATTITPITLTGVTDDGTGIVANYHLKYFVPKANQPIAPTVLTTDNTIDDITNYGAGVVGDLKGLLSTSGLPNNGGVAEPGGLVPDGDNQKTLPLQAVSGGPGSIFGAGTQGFYFDGSGYPYSGSIDTPRATAGGKVPFNLGLFPGYINDQNMSVCNTVTTDASGNKLFYFTGETIGYDKFKPGPGVSYSTDGNLFGVSNNSKVYLGYHHAIGGALDPGHVLKKVNGVLVEVSSQDYYYNTIAIEYTTDAVGLDSASNPSTRECLDTMNWKRYTGFESVVPAQIPNYKDITRIRIRTLMTSRQSADQYFVRDASGVVGPLAHVSHYAMFEAELNNSKLLLDNYYQTHSGPSFASGQTVVPFYASGTTCNRLLSICNTDHASGGNYGTQIEKNSFQLGGFPNGAQDYWQVIDTQVSLNKSASTTTANPGNEILYTLTPNFAGSSISDTITVTDTFPGYTDYVPNSLAGCSGNCSSSVVGSVITLTYTSQAAGVAIPPVTYKLKVKDNVTNANIVNNAEATASVSANNGDSCKDTDGLAANGAEDCTIKSQRQASATVQVATGGDMVIFKSVPKAIDYTNTNFSYDLTIKNNSTQLLGAQEYIDILPFNTDGTITSIVNRAPDNGPDGLPGSLDDIIPSNFVGTIAPDTSSITANPSYIAGSLMYTTVASNQINQDPKCSTNNNTATWSVDGTQVLSSSSTGQDLIDFTQHYCSGSVVAANWVAWSPSSPTDQTTITALKWRMTPQPANTARTISLKLKGRNNASGNLYTNSFSGRAGNQASGVSTLSRMLPVVSNDVTFRVVGGKFGDYVWHDLNSDGVQDAGEPPFANVPVSAIYYGPDGVLGGTDDVTFTTTTDATGKYLFDNMPAGKFEVSVDSAWAVQYIQTYDKDGIATAPTKNKAIFTLSGIMDDYGNPEAGFEDLSIDFGYVAKAQIGDTVYLDSNRDGIQDTTPGSTETGIVGLTVTHICPGIDGIFGTADDMPLQTTTTDADGKYSFSNLPFNPACSVVVTPPADYEQTADPDVTKDNKATLPTTALAPINLTGDFGYAPLASLGDYIWADANKNGIQDSGEKALDGVRIELLDSNNNPVSDPHKTPGTPYILTSTASGFYRFTGLQPGTYKVKFSNLPSGARFTQVLGDNSTAGSDASSEGFTQTVTLGAGQSNLTLDAGIVLGDNILTNTGFRIMSGVIASSLTIVIMAIVIRRKKQIVYTRS
jgi:uncharacterized repeat protein (TIGR01451 family)